MTGVILAGGKNSRMGMKKAFINVHGNALIDNTIAVFEELFLQIIIVTNTPEEFEYTGVKIVRDIIPDKGSLGGLYTGITEAQYERCFVVACDMPYVNGQLIKYIMDIKEYDIIVPKVRGRYEPLFACYSKKCADRIRKQLEENKLKITEFFSQMRVREVLEEEIKIYDDALQSLININTPQDLIKFI